MDVGVGMGVVASTVRQYRLIDHTCWLRLSLFEMPPLTLDRVYNMVPIVLEPSQTPYIMVNSSIH